MRVHVFKNSDLAAKAAATVFASEILTKPDCVIGLATGSTPVKLYKELTRLNSEGVIDFSSVKSFNLDEYVGLSPEHECSYRRFMNENLFDHINIDKKNTFVPDGVNPNPDEYDKMIAEAGGVDLQLLGIGSDGHIGFNEPNSSFVYGTNVVALKDSTIADNARFFNSADEVPKTAISMGIGTIMSAKKIVMIATGKSKAKTVADFINGEVTPEVPASILRMHQNCVVFLDEEAASLI